MFRLAILAAVLAYAADAQPVRAPPKHLAPDAAEVWPFPAPDPRSWWEDKRPRPPEAADPLGRRRLRPHERLPGPDTGVDPSAYRLWGLPGSAAGSVSTPNCRPRQRTASGCWRRCLSGPRPAACGSRSAARRTPLCVQGVAYDLTLLATRGRSVTLHRACDPAEVGEAADVLKAVLGAALGHEPRFDVLFPGGADVSRARTAWRDLIAGGG